MRFPAAFFWVFCRDRIYGPRFPRRDFAPLEILELQSPNKALALKWVPIERQWNDGVYHQKSS
jgi:hypothetical protein